MARSERGGRAARPPPRRSGGRHRPYLAPDEPATVGRPVPEPRAGRVAFRRGPSSMKRSVLICHHDEPLNRLGLARWMASFTDLAAIVVVREPRARFVKRVRREIRRVGAFRFMDVLAFRIYYRLALAGADNASTNAILNDLQQRYADIPASCRIIETPSPNSAEVLSV